MEEGPLRPPSEGAIPSLSHKRLIAYSVGSQNVDLSFKKRLPLFSKMSRLKNRLLQLHFKML